MKGDEEWSETRRKKWQPNESPSRCYSKLVERVLVSVAIRWLKLRIFTSKSACIRNLNAGVVISSALDRYRKESKTLRKWVNTWFIFFPQAIFCAHFMCFCPWMLLFGRWAAHSYSSCLLVSFLLRSNCSIHQFTFWWRDVRASVLLSFSCVFFFFFFYSLLLSSRWIYITLNSHYIILYNYITHRGRAHFGLKTRKKIPKTSINSK